MRYEVVLVSETGQLLWSEHKTQGAAEQRQNEIRSGRRVPVSGCEVQVKETARERDFTAKRILRLRGGFSLSWLILDSLTGGFVFVPDLVPKSSPEGPQHR